MYGFYSLVLIGICIIGSVGGEAISRKLSKREQTINDLSAVVTGLLLALTLPPKLPLWMALIGSLFAIIIGKQIFGGLGSNPFNPALLGRAFLQIAWPKEMSSWISPIDSLSTATPLSIKKYQLVGEIPNYIDLLTGYYAGSLGETSSILILLGAAYLLFKGHISFSTPLAYLLTVAVLSFLLKENFLFHILSGGLFLGAFYMATDPATTPITEKGKIVFGIGCGLLTMLIRLKGSFPEGVCFSILFMNILTSLINKSTRPKRFGT
jgi:electron transport complex protein RnfD